MASFLYFLDTNSPDAINKIRRRCKWENQIAGRGTKTKQQLKQTEQEVRFIKEEFDEFKEKVSMSALCVKNIPYIR
jgi:hypothetical protein